MNVVVYQIIAVLQVLTFGDTVGSNQDIDFRLAAGHQNIPSLGNRGEAGQNIVEGCLKAFDGCLAINAARDNGSIQSVFLLYIGADILIEVFCRVGECGENDHLLIIGVNRILNFVGQQR